MCQSLFIYGKIFGRAPFAETRLRRVYEFQLMRLALLIVAALVAAVPALAHSWYPLACCGNMDCFPITCDQLVETVSGWLYVPTGNLFKREQVQQPRVPSRVVLEFGDAISGISRVSGQAARSIG